MSQTRTNYYHVEDMGKYSDNMTMTCIVMEKGQQVMDCELAAFVGSEVRGSALTKSTQGSRIYLTVQGESMSDVLSFKVVTGTASSPVVRVAKIYPEVKYVGNATLGSYESPVIAVVGDYDLNKDGRLSIGDMALLIYELKKGNQNYAKADIETLKKILLGN